ncbi:MAG TPA: type II CAAX endopeptidase family protein [Acidobacteriaceae bacterium]|jgi:hypothetical protein|nr:type II CAAX endopeptidase family protein [Acidobacteriaceae bacterium]
MIANDQEVAQSAPSGERSLRTMFMNAEGLRPGWAALLFVLIVVAQAVATRAPVNHVLHALHARQPSQLWSSILATAMPALLVLVATAIMARLERRPVLSYGFVGERKLSRLVWGIVTGVAALSVLVLTLKMSGFLIFDGQRLHGAAVWNFALQWGLIALFTGLFEEGLLRGYLQFTLARGIGFWWAALVLSVAFGVAHLPNGGESVLGIVSVVLAAMVFCLSLWLTKSLYWAVGWHAGWDWAQSYLYGVSNSGLASKGQLFASHPVGRPLWSGGLTGPEGSVLMLPLLVLLALGVWVTWRKRRVAEEPVLAVAVPVA